MTDKKVGYTPQRVGEHMRTTVGDGTGLLIYPNKGRSKGFRFVEVHAEEMIGQHSVKGKTRKGPAKGLRIYPNKGRSKGFRFVEVHAAQMVAARISDRARSRHSDVQSSPLKDLVAVKELQQTLRRVAVIRKHMSHDQKEIDRLTSETRSTLERLV